MTKEGGTHPAGFTLVEVLVALLVFSLIAGAGTAMLSFAVRAQGATTKRLDDVAALNRATAALSADLAQAVDRTARDEAGARLPAFVGTAGDVRLVRAGWTNLDGAGRPTLQRVQWGLAGDRLVRTVWPMVDGAAPLAAAAVMDRVAAVRLRYRIAGAWSDAWDGRAGAALPQALELVLTRADGVTFRQLTLVGTGLKPEPRLAPGAAPTPGATPGA